MNKKFDQLKVAIVADWLTNFSGAENVIKSFLNVFPNADLLTTVYVSENISQLGTKKITAGFLQKFPKFFRKKHQLMLPLLPKAIESLDLTSYDLVISSSSFVGKGCITNPETLHICYCHTPTRYLWDTWQQYIAQFPLPKGFNWGKRFLPPFLSRLRMWDTVAAKRPDVYIANSEFIAQRIQKYYRRNSVVITPPVDWNYFAEGLQSKKEDYFLAMGRFTPYKRFDLLIETFQQMPEKKLKIAGQGPDFNRLRHLAEGIENITFLGFVEKNTLPKLLGSARAFLFPQVEDAGISLMEAMAAGTPVIALSQGGAKDIVSEKENGIYFSEQTPESLQKAIRKFEKTIFDRLKVRHSVQKFSRDKFEQKIREFCQHQWENFPKNHGI